MGRHLSLTITVMIGSAREISMDLTSISRIVVAVTIIVEVVVIAIALAVASHFQAGSIDECVGALPLLYASVLRDARGSLPRDGGSAPLGQAASSSNGVFAAH